MNRVYEYKLRGRRRLECAGKSEHWAVVGTIGGRLGTSCFSLRSLYERVTTMNTGVHVQTVSGDKVS